MRLTASSILLLLSSSPAKGSTATTLSVTETKSSGIPVIETESYTFEQYVQDFHKHYPDLEEYARRRAIFERNIQRIRGHNHPEHDPVTRTAPPRYIMGVNPFTDQEADELPRGYSKSTRNRPPVLASLEIEDLPFTVEDVSVLPPAIDWRTKGVTTPVKSQGRCGSCWAFASTAVLESHIAIQTGVLFQLSEQELVSCMPNPLNCGGTGGCAGATAELAFDWIERMGMVQEWDFGYQSYHGENVDCQLTTLLAAQEDAGTQNDLVRDGVPFRTSLRRRRQRQLNAASDRYKGAVVSISGYYKLPTNNYPVLMNAVAKYGPVAVSVACLPWHLYQGGVFYAPLNTTQATDVNCLSHTKLRHMCNSNVVILCFRNIPGFGRDALDHLVVLEGYGTDETTGEDYWLVRNSWGPLWGEQGYVRLKRVDPSTLDDPDSDCGLDTTPADGVACTKDEKGNDVIPPPEKICGNSGILYDATIPLGGYII